MDEEKKVLIFATYAEGEMRDDYTKKYAGFKVEYQNSIQFDADDQTLSFNLIQNFGEEGDLTAACQKLKEIYDSFNNCKIKIFIHHGITDDDVKNELKNKTLDEKLVVFYHHTDSEVWPVLTNIKKICQEGKLQDDKKQDFNKHFNELWLLHPKKKLEEKIKLLSLLKHRIVHLFLPLDIDLQGIATVSEDKKVPYLEEVLKEKVSLGNNLPKDTQGKPAFYRQKLADLWWIVAKYENGEIKKSEKELLADGNAIIDLIDEENRKDENIKNEWKELLNICGLIVDGDNLFEEKNIKEIEHSNDIFSFMTKIDSKIEKIANGNQPIDSGDINELLSYELNNGIKILMSHFSNLKNIL